MSLKKFKMHEIKKKGFAHNRTPRSQRQSIVSGQFAYCFWLFWAHAPKILVSEKERKE